MSQDRHLSRRQFLRGQVFPALHAVGWLTEPTLEFEKAVGTESQPTAQQAAVDDVLPSPQENSITSASALSLGSPRFERSFPVLRPPGAVSEDEFLAGCTRCEACIKACPHQAILQAPPRYRRAAGTPMIDPVQQPCWMCADYPCIASCKPAVLKLALPKKMATARIESFSCLAWQGSFCTVCSEQCPVPLAIVIESGKPRIVEDVCTGCGVCQYVCPAPENAILLMPLSNRPAALAKAGEGGTA